VRCDTWYYSTYRTVETERTSENPLQSGSPTPPQRGNGLEGFQQIEAAF